MTYHFEKLRLFSGGCYVYIYINTHYILHLRSSIDFMLSQAECWLDYEVPEWADKDTDSLRR